MKKWEEIRREENSGLTEKEISSVGKMEREKYVELILDNIPYWKRMFTPLEAAPSFLRGCVSSETRCSETSDFHVTIDVGGPNMCTAVELVDDVVERLLTSANSDQLSFHGYASSPVDERPTERAVIAERGDLSLIEKTGLTTESVSDDILKDYPVIDIRASYASIV